MLSIILLILILLVVAVQQYSALCLVVFVNVPAEVHGFDVYDKMLYRPCLFRYFGLPLYVLYTMFLFYMILVSLNYVYHDFW